MTTIENARLGIRLEIRKTAEETDGALFEFDVVGRARGLLTQTHVHTLQTERHEVIEGSMRLVIDGREHILREGEAMTVPVGAKHRQLAGPGHDGPGRVRVQLRPAGEGESLVRRLAELDVNRWGVPRPLAAAELVRDFGHMGHAAQPPLPVQRALSRAILAVASREYAFVDEWDVAAPRDAVFAAIADARTYPEWWKPVYIDVDADGAPALGKESRQHFKGRLPYHLHTRSRIVALDAPHVIEGEVDGDLRGHGRWTLTDTPGGGTHVRFDWRVHADRRLLRVLTPVLRPALRWNHAWAIARAVEGLEPYARARSAAT
jgi:mannose-6-phosphate isomerase-like protein (cupin superfamily)/uncharacterized protein YndB with AHSA1/START domain